MFASLSGREALRALHSSMEGLSASDITKLRAEYGWNELPQKKPSRILLFLHQFQDVFIYILFAALVISIVLPFLEAERITLSLFTDAFVIFAILILNAVLGFVQEYKAEEALALLRTLSAPNVRVRRQGKEMLIPSRELVPGDIMVLDTGDRVPADGRLLSSSHLQVNESSLTGEVEPVSKDPQSVTNSTQLQDQANMIFTSTEIVAGSCEAVVTAVGISTTLGAIARLVHETRIPVTPLKRRMEALSTQLGLIILALCIVIAVIGLFDGVPFLQILLVSVSLAVAAVPEGLPAVITVCLAMGVRRMVTRNVLVRRLAALEALGSITLICTDKTGTITQNKMSVVETWLPTGASSKDEDLLIRIAASCNRANADLGDPTEVALIQHAEQKGVLRLPIDEELVPFTSEGKHMRTRHGEDEYVKGAPEIVAQLAGGDADFIKKNAEMAARGLRVLACAHGTGKTLKLVGLIAMKDPPRPGVDHAIAEAQRAGIRTVMITGDNAVTAQTVAKSVGIHGKVMEGAEIDTLTLEQLRERAKTTGVYARVSPMHKIAILQAYQSLGEVVAMTGDGINDAPALKAANVGVAMGLKGTQIAREAASIVLTDDNYATIVVAIREGRRLYDNIRKFILFLMRTNFSELLYFLVALILQMPLPYLTIHILWINLMSDGLPALALSVEEAEKDIMQRPPRPRDEGIFSGQWATIALSVLWSFAVGFILFSVLLSQGVSIEKARTMLFTFVIFHELCFTFTSRSRLPLHRIGVFSNRFLLGAVALPFVLQFILLYTPANIVFRLVPLNAAELLLTFSLALLGLIVFELMKIVGLLGGPLVRSGAKD